MTHTCTLAPEELRDRSGELAALAARALRSFERTPAGALRLRFDDDPVTEGELRAAIAAEASCCPFLALDLGRDGDGLVLEVAVRSVSDPAPS